MIMATAAAPPTSIEFTAAADVIQQIASAEDADPENEEEFQTLVERGGDEDRLNRCDSKGEALIVRDGQDQGRDHGRGNAEYVERTISDPGDLREKQHRQQQSGHRQGAGVILHASGLIAGDVGGKDESHDRREQRQAEAILPDLENVAGQGIVIRLIFPVEDLIVAIAEGRAAGDDFRAAAEDLDGRALLNRVLSLVLQFVGGLVVVLIIRIVSEFRESDAGDFRAQPQAKPAGGFIQRAWNDSGRFVPYTLPTSIVRGGSLLPA